MPTLIDWTQGIHGQWTQSAPETKWKTLEESAALLKVIFPDYPRLDAGKPYDGQGRPS
jgi:hypothetical protein